MNKCTYEIFCSSHIPISEVAMHIILKCSEKFYANFTGFTMQMY